MIFIGFAFGFIAGFFLGLYITIWQNRYKGSGRPVNERVKGASFYTPMDIAPSERITDKDNGKLQAKS